MSRSYDARCGGMVTKDHSMMDGALWRPVRLSLPTPAVSPKKPGPPSGGPGAIRVSMNGTRIFHESRSLQMPGRGAKL